MRKTHPLRLGFLRNLREKAKHLAVEYAESRPIFTEVEAVQRAILFAKETGCKLHLVHISTSEAIQSS